MPMRQGPTFAVTSSSLPFEYWRRPEHLPRRVQADEVDRCLRKVEADRDDLLQHARAG